ncbi:MAG: CoA transferase, partial [Alphaproteobacteria bacterium]|nr:CoA transferase [Alphaproteobacteria bacterium]
MKDTTVNTDNFPLAGVRILDFTQVMLGPCATQMLADFGADVIKIERPGAGDLSRHFFGEQTEAGYNNAAYSSLNRNKRSIEIDTKLAAGKQIVYDMVRQADVVVDNFRAGVMDRLGFGYEALSEINPRIICASGTGFGESGPYAHKGGQDVLAQ